MNTDFQFKFYFQYLSSIPITLQLRILINFTGKMCSILSVVEAILPIIYVPIYTTLYAKTLETLPGAFYILGAMMSLPATFIFM